MSADIEARPWIERKPLHPDITAEQIDALVEEFYARIAQDSRLGPIFGAAIADWPPHLAKMKAFWRSVLLRSGDYHGRPVPAHMALRAMVEPDDFGRWLALFRPVARRIFAEEPAALTIAAAERIAQSLWMAMFGGLVDGPPAWRNPQAAR